MCNGEGGGGGKGVIITGIGSSKRSKKIGDNISRIFHKKLGRKKYKMGKGLQSAKKRIIK